VPTAELKIDLYLPVRAPAAFCPVDVVVRLSPARRATQAPLHCACPEKEQENRKKLAQDRIGRERHFF